ncbi:MAG TPA: chorismate mutase [Thermoanaerobaculia bacterium]|nr:chorismate mutase [Thermoanaerobaculia bacterium]
MPDPRAPESVCTTPRSEWTAARLLAWRREIDELDADLVELLQRRGELVLRIARLKRQAGIAARDTTREGEILRAVTAASEGPFDAEALIEVFRAVLAASLRLHDLETGAAETSPDIAAERGL